MKKMFIFILMLLFFPVVHASVDTWDVDVSLNDDMTSSWIVRLSYDANVPVSDYYITSDMSNVRVLADGKPAWCELKKYSIGSSVICENINAKTMEYRFNTKDFITVHDTVRRFSYKFSITQATKNFSVIVRLPLGSYLADPLKLGNIKPFEPSSGSEGSDGRRIFIKWQMEKPTIGETMDVSVVYEVLSGNEVFITSSVIAAIVIALLAFLFMRRRRNIESILPLLTENERKVMEIVLKSKKPVDQREVVKVTDFSKTKVSRIIKELEKRELLEKIPKGRTNLLKFKKKSNEKSQPSSPVK